MSTAKTVETQCLYCKAPLNRATSHLGDFTPDAGDVSLCVRCGGIMIFTDRLGNLRKPTAEEIAEIKQDLDYMSAIAVIKSIHSKEN